MMDCVLSGSLLVVFSLFFMLCVFFEQINSLSLSLCLRKLRQLWFVVTLEYIDDFDTL